MQVCSMWRAVSDSERLWRNLTNTIWQVRNLTHDTWKEEYIHHHVTARNFCLGRWNYSTWRVNGGDYNRCSRLSLSTNHLAAGYSDGSVRLFRLTSRTLVATFYPLHPDDPLARPSTAISGIVLSDTRLVFASLNGDVYVALINNAPITRRSVLGDVDRDGTLVDFSGCTRWWVGLYIAGVSDRAFHIWDGETEELLYTGGRLIFQQPPNIHQQAPIWHQHPNIANSVGRVRITSQEESAVACTSKGFFSFKLRNPSHPLVAFGRSIRISAFDLSGIYSLIVDSYGIARVHQVSPILTQVCQFDARGLRATLGCMNSGQAFLLCNGDEIRVWGNKNGRFLYRLRERLGNVGTMALDDRHFAVCSRDGLIFHLWDFGAQ